VIPAGLAAIIASSVPLIVALLSRLLLCERLSWIGHAGLMVGFAGVLLIMINRITAGDSVFGLVLCIIGAAALAGATLIVRGVDLGAGLLMVVGLQMLVGSASLAPVVFMLEDPTAFRLTGSLITAFIYITIVPGVIAAFSLVVIWASLQLELSPAIIVGDSMQPRAFPIFLMVLNLILVGILTWQLLKNPPEKRALEEFPTWGSIGLLALFYPLTVYLDMFIGIAVIMFLMCLLWGERRWYVAGALAVVTPVFIFFLFDEVLQVRFPRGVLTNLYYG